MAVFVAGERLVLVTCDLPDCAWDEVITAGELDSPAEFATGLVNALPDIYLNHHLERHALQEAPKEGTCQTT
jgi:hypothetical protein